MFKLTENGLFKNDKLFDTSITFKKGTRVFALDGKHLIIQNDNVFVVNEDSVMVLRETMAF